jgi:ribonuclease VapC
VSQRFAVDSSVLIATIKSEEDSALFLEPLLEGPAVIGWPTVLETRLWIIRHGGREAGTWFGEWLSAAGTSVIPFEYALNFGDCMSYSVAAHLDAPLLFKGSDFGKTDVRVHKASIVIA